MFRKYFIYVTLIALCLVSVLLSAQSRKELETKRKKLQRDIAVTSKLLRETRQDTREALSYVTGLHNQIKKREELLQNLNDEIERADELIARDTVVIAALQDDLSRLLREYSHTMRNVYKTKSSQNMGALLLSADDMEHMFRRWQYLRRYDNFRKMQAEAIGETQKTLANKVAELGNMRDEKLGFITGYQVQKSELDKEAKEKNLLVNKLKKDERRLMSELQKQEAAREHFNSAIEDAIKREMKARRTRAEKREAEKNKKRQTASPAVASSPTAAPATPPKPSLKPIPDTPEDVALSSNFASNKGRLPWPVGSGTIYKPYGPQAHPTVQGVQIDNKGIDIATANGADVRCVFDGEVASVQFVPGNGNMVMVAHGSYYTVYTMDKAIVNEGDKVTARDVIGKAGSNNLYQQPIVHFEIWKDKVRQNPANWIRK